jgi:hypothetical protein
VSRYNKALMSIIAAVIAFWATAVVDGVTITDYINGGIALVTAFGVYLVPNVPDQPWAKAAVAVLGAMLTVLLAAYSDSVVTSAEILNIALAAFGALGVGVVANVSPGAQSEATIVGVGAGIAVPPAA